MRKVNDQNPTYRNPLKKFIITLLSKDNNQYIFSCRASNEEEAIEKSNNQLISNNWEIYKYKIEKVIEL